MKKIYNLLICFLFCLTVCLTFFSNSYAGDSNNSINILSLSIDKTEVLVNDQITFTLEIESGTQLNIDRTKWQTCSYISVKNKDYYNSEQFLYFTLQEDGKYTTSLTITDSMGDGKWEISSVRLFDIHGNGAYYHYDDIFFIKYSDLELYSIPFLNNDTVIESDCVIEDRVINGNLYIAHGKTVKVKNTKVLGDIYVFGKLSLVNSSAETLYVKGFKKGTTAYPSSNGYSNVYKSNISSIDTNTNYDIDGLPLRFDTIQSSNGMLYMSGIKKISTVDMYYNNKKIEINEFGKFIIENENIGDADSIEITFKTKLGDILTKAFPVNKTISMNGYSPIIYAENKVYCVDSNFDLYDGVSAYDKEEGNLEGKIEVDSSSLENKVGTYVVKYSCQDSDGNYGEKNILITIRNHNYEFTSFEWEADASNCVLNRTCIYDDSHTVSDNMIISSEINNIANCIEKGSTLYTATFEEYVSTKELNDISINPNNHIGETEIKNKTDASCSEYGYTGDEYCKSCGNLIKKGTSIDKLEHNVVIDPYVEPTYKKTGLTEGSHCSICNAIIVPQSILPIKQNSLATGKFKLLKDYILKQSTTDLYGNKCISVQLDDNVINERGRATIGYSSTNHEFIFWTASYPVKDPSMISYVEMTIEENGSTQAYVSSEYLYTSAEVLLDVKNYSKDINVNFSVDGLLDNGDQAQKTYNKLLQAAFYGWDICLLDFLKSEVNMADLGFVSYENSGMHEWDSGVITRQPTYTSDGIITYTCKICGETKTETVSKLIDDSNNVSKITNDDDNRIIDSEDDSSNVGLNQDVDIPSYSTNEKSLEKSDYSSSNSEHNNVIYRNEWVNGRWYSADGSQTYTGTLSWKCNSTGWWVEDSDGWYPVSCWQKIDGSWYYFTSSGYMASSEYYNGYWFNSNGSWDESYYLTWKSNSTGWWVEDKSGWWPSSQWLKIDGCWYYFNSSGYMVTSQYIDGYWIGSDGVCH